jgi:hypothetical protein
MRWNRTTGKESLKTLAAFALLAGICFGLFIVVVAPIEMVRKVNAEHWPARPAVITKSYLSFQRGSATRPASGSYWRANICATWRDSGEPFCVTRIRYGGFRVGEGKDDALATVSKYPVGTHVDVHYSPQDPRHTVLEARSPWTEMRALFAAGLALLLVPVVLWAWSRLRR